MREEEERSTKTDERRNRRGQDIPLCSASRSFPDSCIHRVAVAHIHIHMNNIIFLLLKNYTKMKHFWKQQQQQQRDFSDMDSVKFEYIKDLSSLMKNK